MKGNIIFYDYELTEYGMKFKIIKLISGQYQLKIENYNEDLEYARINKYKTTEYFISYLEMMFNLLQQLTNFRKSIIYIENFDDDPPAWKIINIFDVTFIF